ncbi:TRIC cation channel family protein [Candidatus Odyssella acanthamoebae]|uniref:Solute-binding protein family 3/N-terminal domain-containing protein n=1 Tax=Candidatus Odyssella acanthamoebae TaxID=91604 RepID=A0A077AZ03_9PROT|nr:TRIC cation channel family protein [Candidatus Paracaedibacter acanthamoebae]AIK97244.1 hypothetical protein ID47_11645 [Candidatus Paracaedibacter acanthamoebae]
MSYFKKTIICCFMALGISLGGLQTNANETKYSTSDFTLIGGWYPWDPYQYLKIPSDQTSLTGLDIELQKLIMKKAGLEVQITPVSWKQHQEDLKTGARAYAMGAFYSEQRAKDFYISEPYRFEENSLFVRRRDMAKMKFDNVEGFLAYARQHNLKIGVIDKYQYASPVLNNFINDPKNEDIIVRSDTDTVNLNFLLTGKIQGFIADRIVGSTIIWRQNVGREVAEKNLHIKAPIYILMSKKKITEEQYKEINKSIQSIKNSSEYTKIVSWYLYPVLLLETTETDWFYFIEIIGIIAFALSGLVVAYRCNASLFGTFILALLPSFGGGVLRDVIFGRYPVWFMQASFYILLVITIVVVGFILAKLASYNLNFLRKYSHKKYFSPRIFEVCLMVTDAIGLAAFTVTGVLVSLIVKADPLWLWGPFFAFLTGAGGGILRDIVAKEARVGAIHGPLYPEIAIFWGGAFSVYLITIVNDVDPIKIKISVMVTIVAALLTRILIYYYRVPNIFYIREKDKSGLE